MANEISDTHELYDAKRFSWRQTRDCLTGPDAVKRAKEVYLPMPSGMIAVADNSEKAAEQSGYISHNNLIKAYNADVDYQRQYLPWWHPNPAYRAYLMRARFPDITANTLRGFVGITTKTEPEVDLPDSLSDLEELATMDGFSIRQLYSKAVSEVFATGKFVLVVEPIDATFRIATYNAEANINWEYGVVDNIRQLIRCVFYEGCDKDGKEKYLEYELLDGKAIAIKYLDGEIIETTELKYRGKTINRLPIVMIGSEDNTADPDVIPLLGLTDIALTIYRENADLAQGHFLTCNPTLFIYGIRDNEKPRTIGSTVCVAISNPSAKAEYPPTDTSAFEHIRTYIADLYQEAIAFGIGFFGNSNQKESGEALKTRKSANGTSLVHIVNLVSEGIRDAIVLMLEWMGSPDTEFEFEGNTEFSEIEFSAQDLTALVASWLQGAIDHDTLLDNFRAANIIDADKTNEFIKNAILSSKPSVTEGLDDEDADANK